MYACFVKSVSSEIININVFIIFGIIYHWRCSVLPGRMTGVFTSFWSRGDGTDINRQHRKLTLEKKILPPLLPGQDFPQGNFLYRGRNPRPWAGYESEPTRPHPACPLQCQWWGQKLNSCTLLLDCEPVWPKEGPRFDSASALLSLEKVWSANTVYSEPIWPSGKALGW